MENLGDQVVVIVCQHVRQRLAKIPKKSLTGLGTLDYAAGQNRHTWARIITTPLGEFRDQIVGPVLSSRLPAIINHVLKTTLTHQLANRILVVV